MSLWNVSFSVTKCRSFLYLILFVFSFFFFIKLQSFVLLDKINTIHRMMMLMLMMMLLRYRSNQQLLDNPSDSVSKLYNPSGVDVSYSTRHVEESWHHLMKSEDTAKFKQIAVCNFDFLLAAVSNSRWLIIDYYFFLFFHCCITITTSFWKNCDLFIFSDIFIVVRCITCLVEIIFRKKWKKKNLLCIHFGVFAFCETTFQLIK